MDQDETSKTFEREVIELRQQRENDAEIIHGMASSILQTMRREEPAADNYLSFYLTRHGALSRSSAVPGDRLYNIEAGSNRYAILRTLVNNSYSGRYTPTKNLAEELGLTEHQIRRACGELRVQIRRHFSGIRDNNVIESKTRSGYRINPLARVTMVP